MADSDIPGLDRPGDAAAAEDGLPEPPPPDGPGLFGARPATAPAGPADGATAPPPAVAPAPPRVPYRVLARKYRPATFAELIGQEALVRTLRNAFAQGRVPHALLLTGVRGVGKTTTARIIARALNCVGPDGAGGPTIEPCGTCPECRAILADRHPDVLELDAASNNGVDDVRELRETLRYRPAQGRFKIIILDEVHMLSGAAFNALLKTLEEPPPQVTFMLATTDLQKVPLTIRSRCQTHHLRRVAQPELIALFARIAALEGVAVEEEALRILARAADGSVRDGLSLLDQAIALGEGSVSAAGVGEMLGLADRGLVLDLMEAAMAGDLPRCLALMDRAHELGADPAVVLTDLLDLTHLLTRFVCVPALRTDRTLREEDRTRGVALASQLSMPVLGRAWQMLLKGLEEVLHAPDRRAAAEMVLIRLAHLAELPPPGELVKRLLDGAGTLAAGATPRATPNAAAAAPPRAVAGGNGAAALALEPGPGASQPMRWEEVVALASGRRPMLHAHLMHSVHPVRMLPGRIEMRVRPDAPRDLSAELAAMLGDATGTRWTIVLSNAAGEPTLAEQTRAADAMRRSLAASHPLVQAIVAAFPGATIEAVRDVAPAEAGAPAGAAPEAEDAPADVEAAEIEPDDEWALAPPDPEAGEAAGLRSADRVEDR
jgi:DNA polymerase-3 subunit gamma/tau